MALLKGPILSMFIVGCLTFAMYDCAVKAQQGIHNEATGRRAGVKMLLIAAGEGLGTTGTLILGGVLELALVGWAVSMIKNGAVNSGSDD